MLHHNSKSGGLAYSEKSKINHENSKTRDALNDGFENEDLDEDETDTSTAEQPKLSGEAAKVNNPANNKKNDKEQDLPATKPEKYDDLASSGT